MRLSRILLLIGAFALPALPAAAQGKAIGKPAGVGKPTTTIVKGKSVEAKGGTLVKGNSADHAKGGKPTTETTTASTDGAAVGQQTLEARIQRMMDSDSAMAARIKTAIGATSLTDATAGWKNSGQFLAAVNAVTHNPGITFLGLQTEMTGPNQSSLGEAVKTLNAAASTPLPTTTETTPTTTTP